MNEIKYQPIGIIHSPHKQTTGTPIQPTAAEDINGRIEIFPKYLDGLKDLDGFSHIILIFHFHLANKVDLQAKPFMDNKKRGIFSIRGPNRPNPIGMSIVRLQKIEGNIIHIKDVDIVDKTPLLDIKPYVPKFDSREDVKIGWLEKNIYKLPKAKDDDRFK